MRPSKIWKSLPADTKLAAADAFWRDDDAPDADMQRIEAVVAIAKKLNFRPKSVQAMSLERRINALARLPDVSDGVATRALIAHHFRDKRRLMSAFLDALGIEHDDGMITNEDGVGPPDRERLGRAVDKLRPAFPEADVTLYLRTLIAVDADTWANLDGLVT